jgi:hypothetical protein
MPRSASQRAAPASDQSENHEVAPRQRGVDVDLRRGHRVARALRRLARAQQRLGGDARPVRALTADALVLDDGDAHAALRERGGAVLAGGAAAEDDDVIARSHLSTSVDRVPESGSRAGAPVAPVEALVGGPVSAFGRRRGQRDHFSQPPLQLAVDSEAVRAQAASRAWPAGRS